MANWVTTCLVLVSAYIVAALLETASLLQFTGHLQGQRLCEYYGFAACACLALVVGARAWPRLGQWRRGLGLAAFGFAIAHTLLAYEHVFGGRLEGIEFLPDTERWATWVGLAALLLLVPLVLTSANFWVRRLGVRRWSRLHRLVFPAALLAVGHALWLGASGVGGQLLVAALAVAALVARLRPTVPLPGERHAEH